MHLDGFEFLCHGVHVKIGSLLVKYVRGMSGVSFGSRRDDEKEAAFIHISHRGLRCMFSTRKHCSCFICCNSIMFFCVASCSV